MEAGSFDEEAWFDALDRGGVRALLIGRRACVLYGLPLLTADYDLWISPEEIDRFNAESAPFSLHPSVGADEARSRGRYVLENDEHVDVICAGILHTLEGVALEHAQVWSRRKTVKIGTASVALPALEDLIALKKIAARPRDIEDIRALEALLRDGEP